MENTSRADQKIELLVAAVLRSGVLISALVVAAGGVLYLLRYNGPAPDYSVFRSEPAGLRSLSGVWKGAVAGQTRALIESGILLLVATPIARVILSVWSFARERDRLYTVVTLVVLGLLLFSLLAHF